MKSQPIFSGTCISVHSITEQAAKFLANLGERERRDLQVVATILDTSLATGRPPGGRSERVRGSAVGLWELRITPPGRRGPHTRALYVCAGRELLIVRGVLKAQRGIPRREIELAERDALVWRRGNNESAGPENTRGSP